MFFKHRRLTGTWFQKSLDLVQQLLDRREDQTSVILCPSGSCALFQLQAFPKFRWDDDLALGTNYALVSCHELTLPPQDCKTKEIRLTRPCRKEMTTSHSSGSDLAHRA